MDKLIDAAITSSLLKENKEEASRVDPVVKAVIMAALFGDLKMPPQLKADLFSYLNDGCASYAAQPVGQVIDSHA